LTTTDHNRVEGGVFSQVSEAPLVSPSTRFFSLSVDQSSAALS